MGYLHLPDVQHMSICNAVAVHTLQKRIAKLAVAERLHTATKQELSQEVSRLRQKLESEQLRMNQLLSLLHTGKPVHVLLIIMVLGLVYCHVSRSILYACSPRRRITLFFKGFNHASWSWSAKITKQ